MDAEGLQNIDPFVPGQTVGYEFAGTHGPHSVWLEGDTVVIGIRLAVRLTDDNWWSCLGSAKWVAVALQRVPAGFSTMTASNPLGHHFYVVHRPDQRVFRIETRVFADFAGGDAGRDPIQVSARFRRPDGSFWTEASRPRSWRWSRDDPDYNLMAPVHEMAHLFLDASDEYGWRRGMGESHAYHMHPELGDRLLIGEGPLGFGPPGSLMCGSGVTLYKWHWKSLIDELNGISPAGGEFDVTAPLLIRPPGVGLDGTASMGSPWALADSTGRPLDTGFVGVQPEVFGDETWWRNHAGYRWDAGYLALVAAGRVVSALWGPR